MNEVVATANCNEYLSKQEILDWINDLLKLKIQKINTLGTGAIYCQIFDSIHMGKINMSKVNWKAKFDYEFINNFKLLQQGFQNIGINKVIDVKKLIQCKYLDNLEFIQWVRRYFDAYQLPIDYDPIQRRNGDIDFTFIEKTKGKDSGARTGNVAANTSQNTSRTLLPPRVYAPPSQVSKNSSFSNISCHNEQDSNENNNILSMVVNTLKPEGEGKERSQYTPHFEALKAERDFYFYKLRDIDHLLEVSRDSTVDTLIGKIHDILYSTPEKLVLVLDDGDVRVANKENISGNLQQRNFHYNLEDLKQGHSADGLAIPAQGSAENRQQILLREGMMDVELFDENDALQEIALSNTALSQAALQTPPGKAQEALLEDHNLLESE